MPDWEQIATTSELAPGESKECVVGGRIVALFHTDDGYFAIDGICAHAGGPIAEGAIDGCIVTCPWHGWQYDVSNGVSCLNDQIRLQPFPLKIDGETILVDVS